jgi:hypothetical protein
MNWYAELQLFPAAYASFDTRISVLILLFQSALKQ